MVKAAPTHEQAHHERVIRAAVDKMVADKALLEVRVIAARRAGISWNVIARGVGTSRQSAQGRFERLPEIAAMIEDRA
jgi:hypothetical protein